MRGFVGRTAGLLVSSCTSDEATKTPAELSTQFGFFWCFPMIKATPTQQQRFRVQSNQPLLRFRHSSISKNSRRLSTRGAALPELAIVLPFLVIISIGLIDISRMILQYLELNAISYEGARYASTLGELEQGDFRMFHNLHLIDPGSKAGQRMMKTSKHHYLVHKRLEQLIDLYGVNIHSLHISTQRILPTPTGGVARPEDNSVTIRIAGVYDSILQIYSLPIIANIQGGYLKTNPWGTANTKPPSRRPRPR